MSIISFCFVLIFVVKEFLLIPNGEKKKGEGWYNIFLMSAVTIYALYNDRWGSNFIVIVSKF